MTCILTFMHAFYISHLSLSSMTKTILHKVFVRTIDSLYVSINHYLQHVLRFYIISYLCNAFVFCLKKQDLFKKSCVDFDFISLIRSYVLYTYSALLSKMLCTRLLLFGRATFYIVKIRISYLGINCLK